MKSLNLSGGFGFLELDLDLELDFWLASLLVEIRLIIGSPEYYYSQLVAYATLIPLKIFRFMGPP